MQWLVRQENSDELRLFCLDDDAPGTRFSICIHTYTCTHTHMHINACIYIYIYITQTHTYRQICSGLCGKRTAMSCSFSAWTMTPLAHVLLRCLRNRVPFYASKLRAGCISKTR